MSAPQNRRPAGIPIGGQFAPKTSPEAGIELIDDDLIQAAEERTSITADPKIAHLDESARKLAEHLGYRYAGADSVDEHHGLTCEPRTIGLISFDGGKTFVFTGTKADGHSYSPFGVEVFTPEEMEQRIAYELTATESRAPQRQALDRLEVGARQLVEQLGYRYVDADTVAAHPGATVTPGVVGLASEDGGKTYRLIGQGNDGYAVLPLGVSTFTPEQMGEQIAARLSGAGEDVQPEPAEEPVKLSGKETIAKLFPNGEPNRRRRGHMFLPGGLVDQMPALYDTESTPLAEKTVYAHYFAGGADWYIAELDRETGTAFGHCDLGLGFPEWGYVNLVELAEIERPFPIERDKWFKPQSAKDAGLVK